MSDTIACPRCGAPAGITDWFRLGSTDGALERQDRLREQSLAHPAGGDSRADAACRRGARPGGIACLSENSAPPASGRGAVLLDGVGLGVEDSARASTYP
jgi:hypothetical protein